MKMKHAAALPKMTDFADLRKVSTPDMGWSNEECSGEHCKVAMPSAIFDMLLSGRKDTSMPLADNGNAPQLRMISFRASLKQLWFLAYRSQEISGRKFSCEDAYGYQARPCSFFIGFWEDGSECWANCYANNINGPYWVNFTLEMIVAKTHLALA